MLFSSPVLGRMFNLSNTRAPPHFCRTIGRHVIERLYVFLSICRKNFTVQAELFSPGNTLMNCFGLCFVASDFLTAICHLAIVNVCVIIILSIGNTQISILLLCFLYLFVELMITMNEYFCLFKPTTKQNKTTTKQNNNKTKQNKTTTAKTTKSNYDSVV